MGHDPDGRVRGAVAWSRRHLGMIALVALSLVGAVAVVFAWSVSSPLGASPDDDFHQTSIWCPGLSASCPTRTAADGTLEVEVPVEVFNSECYVRDPAQSGACLTNVHGATGWTDRVNNGLYPGGFYDVMHWFVGPDVYQSVVVMRLFNGLVAIALLGFLALLLPGPGRRLMAYATLTVCIPLLVYIVCSVNPSSWAVTGVLVAWFGMYATLVARSWPRVVAAGVVAVVGAMMAVSARSDAGLYLVLAAGATVILHTPQIWKRLWRLVLPVVVAVIGLVGFFSASQSGLALDGSGSDRGPGSGWHLLISNVMNLPVLLVSYAAGFMGLNWLDTVMPSVVWVPVVGLSLALIFLGLHHWDWRKTLAAGGMAAAYVAIPLIMLQAVGYGVGAWVQPRYIAPLLPVLLALFLWRPRIGGAPRLSVAQTVVTWVLLVGAQAVALQTQIRRFTTGLDVFAVNLNADIEWWHGGPLPMQTWIFGSVGFALLAVVLFAVRRPSPDESALLAIDQDLPVPWWGKTRSEGRSDPASACSDQPPDTATVAQTA